MAWSKEKGVLTTGDVANFIGVNFRTVIRWIRQGRLKAYQLPGRGDNRVLNNDFLTFLREHKIPIPEEFRNNSNRVLIIEEEPRTAKAIVRALSPDFETMVATTGFQAGNLANRFSPAVVTIEPRMEGLGGLDAIAAFSGAANLTAKVLVVSGLPMAKQEAALKAGAAEVIRKPFGDKDLVAAVGLLMGHG